MWFLIDSIAEEMRAALGAGFELTAEQKINLEKESVSLGKNSEKGSTAVIPIEGVLTQKRDYRAAYFGGGNTLYPDIVASVKAANSDPRVKNIVLNVGYSPGGNVMGLFDAMEAIRDSGKPVTAVVKHGALSGAYGLVSQAGEIVATSRGAQFGSVGVAFTTYVLKEEVNITSTEAPDKRPDLTTEDGKKAIQKQLDEIHELFAESIAAGRGITAKEVNENFGRGAVYLADHALKAGMIDSIDKPSIEINQKPEVRNMDLSTLKSEYPALFAEIVAIGVNQERDRVSSHLIMGQASGDMETAIAAVNDGHELTAKYTALYQAAALNRRDVQDRVDDNPKTEDVKKVESSAAESFEAAVEKEYLALIGKDGE